MDEYTMLIYGIRCSKETLVSLPKEVVADYYTDYGLLVFPTYSRATTLDAKGRLSPLFWDTVRLILQAPTQVYAMDLEQPFVSEMEASAVKSIQTTSTALPDWYHVPLIVMPGMSPQLVVA